MSAGAEEASRIVRVLPDVAAVRKTFDYTVPSVLDDRVRVGTEVRVLLHGRRIGAWVVEEDVEPNPELALRAIESVRGWGPPPSVVAVAQWAAWRWAGPVSSFLKSASAPRSVGALPRTPTTSIERDEPPGDAMMAEAFSSGTVVVRLSPATDFYPFAAQAARLLQGAPESSGVLVLVPEHDQAARLTARLRAQGHRVALLPADWALARAGGCVVVGTRASAFAPLPRLAGALVLDAHDEAFHEQRAPTWCAWEVVAERARRDRAPCALVSPCPTLDLLAAGRPVTSSRRAEREGWPAVEIVDRRDDDPRTGLFSERLVSLVRRAGTAQGRRVLCVLNRTGRVRLVACASCYEIARCERCGSALEVLEDHGPPRLRCRRCGEERPVVCARCGAGRMRALRVGVSRAREELEALAGVPVTEVWGVAGRRSSSTAPGAGGQGNYEPAPPSARQVSEHSQDDGNAAVVVGTEALLHRARKAHVVAFLDFDAELLAPRMRSAEEAFALLARASRLVSGSTGFAASSGRAPGEILVQTRLPGHHVLAAAVTADPSRLSEAERPVREALRLPPFSAIAVISGAVADSYGAALRDAAPPSVEVSGPVDGKWSVRADGHDDLCGLLEAVARPAGRLRVEVDPVRA